MRVLLITYHFPPDAAVGAVRPYHFARLLPQQGIETWVLTVNPEFAEFWDRDLVIEDIPQDQIFRTPVRKTKRRRLVEIVSAAKRKIQTSRATASSTSALPPLVNQSTGWLQATPLRRLLLSLLYFPEHLAGWYQPAIAMAEKALLKVNFDAVISTSPPRVAHLIAYRLAGRYKLPWVMDLRDPWYDTWKESGDRSKTLEVLYRHLFNKCAKRADAIVLNTERLREQIINQMPEVTGKAITIPNGCPLPPSDAVLSLKQQTGHFSIGHFGSVYGLRSGEVFLRGLRLWLDQTGLTAPDIFVRFRGFEFGDTPDYVNALNLSPVVSLCPPVSRNQVPDLMGEDYLLLLIANNQSLGVPAKLYEYITSGRRILAITEPDSATANLLRGAPGCTIAQSPEDVAEALRGYRQEYQQGRGAEVDHSVLRYENSYLCRAEKLAEVIKSFRTAPFIRGQENEQIAHD